jgi:anti-anti-sigma factor
MTHQTVTNKRSSTAWFQLSGVGTNRYLLRLHGELDMATSALAFEAVRAVPANAVELAVDLASVSFMNWRGLRSLIAAVAAVRERGCVAWVKHPGPARRIATLAGLNDVFENALDDDARRR